MLARALKRPVVSASVHARFAIVQAARDPSQPFVALNAARRAIELYPQSPWGYLARGWVYLSCKQDAHGKAREGYLERAGQDFATARKLGGGEHDPFVEYSQRCAEQARRPDQAPTAEQQTVSIWSQLTVRL